jgi:hypothetical protein
MSLRSQVWDLLIAHEGEWLTRSEIEQVGGAEATRRLKDIKNKVVGFDIKRRGDSYRLVRTTVFEQGLTCVKCKAPPNSETQPSVDPRWRLGRCPMCGKGAIFEKARPLE